MLYKQLLQRFNNSKRLKGKFAFLITSLLLMLIMSACGGGLSNQGGTPVSLTLSLPASKALGKAVPINVSSITIRITASDITEPIVDTFQVLPGETVTRTYYVPSGDDRLFSAEAHDSLGVLRYAGSSGPVHVPNVSAVSITMEDVAEPTVTVTGISTWQNTPATPVVTCIDGESGCDAATRKFKYYASAQPCSTNYSEYTDSGTITTWQFVCVAEQDMFANTGFTGTAVEFKITSWIYVTNYARNSVSVIRGADNAVIDEITVGTNPTDIGANISSKKIYVGNYNGGGISVIDSASNTVSTSIPLTGDEASKVAVNHVTNTIYVTDMYSLDVVYIIDGATDTEIKYESTNDCYTTGVGVNTVTNMIYVDAGCGAIEVMDGTTNTFTGSSFAGPGSYDMPSSDVEVNSTTNTIYSTYEGNGIDVSDGVTETLTTNVSTGTSSMGIAINETTNTVYTANWGTNTVSKINGSTNTWVKDITVGNNPFGIVVDDSLNRIYSVNQTDETVSVIDGATDTVTATINLPVGGDPWEVTILPVLP